MNEIKAIIKYVSNSDYLSEWILSLKDNKILFSPKKNIKPCIQDEKSARSRYWPGLDIINSYCKRGITNKDVDEFIIGLLKDSIQIYKGDKEEDKYKKLNSSYLIIDELLEIAVSKKEFIDNIDIGYLTKICLDSVLNWPFSVAYLLYRMENVLIQANADTVFKIYKTIIEHSDKLAEYEKYLYVPGVISHCAPMIFEYSKQYITSCTDKFYDMGSFYDYNASYINQKNIVMFKWLKESSKNIDVTELRSTIETFINKESKLLRKSGLCLININYEKTKKLFFDNISLFLNCDDFYADLINLFSNNANILLDKKDILIDEIEKATFGLDNKDLIFVLKNHIFGILKKNGWDVPFTEESRQDNEYASNFNKLFYSVPYNSTDDLNDIYNSIKELDINEAIINYNNFKNGSHYLEDIINKSYIKYLLNKYPDNYLEYLDMFDYKFSNSLMFYYSYGEYKDINKLFDVMKVVVKNMSKDIEYSKCIHSIVNSMRYLYDTISINEIKSFVLSVDYKFIPLEDYKNLLSDDIITICINEPLYSYLDNLCFLANGDFECKKLLLKVIDYFIREHSCSKLKTIIASIFPKLLLLDNEYAMSLSEYMFSNLSSNGINLSYSPLVLSNCHSEELLDVICGRKDFFDYLSLRFDKGDNLMAQNIMLNWLFSSFVIEGKHKEIIDVLCSNTKNEALLEIIRSLNAWLKKEKYNNTNLERIGLFFSEYSEYIKSNPVFAHDNDQFIRELSETILITKNRFKCIWDVVLLLFDKFNNYVFDETIRLIKEYQDIEYKNISIILKKYFSNYKQFYSSEDTIVEVFKMVSDNQKYKKLVKEWRVLLVQKNADLAEKLIIN